MKGNSIPKDFTKQNVFSDTQFDDVSCSIVQLLLEQFSYNQ